MKFWHKIDFRNNFGAQDGNGKWTQTDIWGNHLNEDDHVVDHLEEWRGLGIRQEPIHCDLNDLATTNLSVYVQKELWVLLSTYIQNIKACVRVCIHTYIHTHHTCVHTHIHSHKQCKCTYIHTYNSWIVNTLSSNAFSNAMAWNRTCLSIPSANKFKQRFTTPLSFRDARKVSTESSLHVSMYVWVCMYVFIYVCMYVYVCM